MCIIQRHLPEQVEIAGDRLPFFKNLRTYGSKRIFKQRTHGLVGLQIALLMQFKTVDCKVLHVVRHSGLRDFINVTLRETAFHNGHHEAPLIRNQCIVAARKNVNAVSIQQPNPGNAFIPVTIQRHINGQAVVQRWVRSVFLRQAE